MKIYTIIGGVNGTGKSSLTGVLRETVSDLGIIIDADQLSKQYGSNLAGGKAAVRQIRQCINTGCSFTQETTLSGSKTMRTIKLAQDNGYYIRMYYIGLGSVEESIERIANRHRKGGHTIPEEMCAGDIRNVLTACLTLCRFAMRFFSMIMRMVLWKSVDTAAVK